MSRPKNPIVAETQLATGVRVEVMTRDSLWVLTYQDQPVSICLRPWTAGQPRYLKSTWNNAKLAATQVRKLNRDFDTDQFAVRQLY
jgi:hypothetical protein